jgi:hypothetical protein
MEHIMTIDTLITILEDMRTRYDVSGDIVDELGWVRLPKDANGVPIHVGDVLTDGEYTFTVYELTAYGDDLWSICNKNGNAWAACDVTHCYNANDVELTL